MWYEIVAIVISWWLVAVRLGRREVTRRATNRRCVIFRDTAEVRQFQQL